jgi:hypothetical protein
MFLQFRYIFQPGIYFINPNLPAAVIIFGGLCRSAKFFQFIKAIVL